ncbi:unnamed protein product [Caenorhabditis nigoni]
MAEARIKEKDSTVTNVEQNATIPEISNKIDLITESLSECLREIKSLGSPAKKEELEDFIPVALECEKEFILKHVFKDVANFEEDSFNFSEWEDHFDVNWYMNVKRRNNHLVFNVFCKPISLKDEWSIRTNIEFEIVGKSQNHVIGTDSLTYGNDNTWGKYQVLDCQNKENEYFVNGKLTVEAKVTIVETTGLGKKKIREFDESQIDVSDIILVVRDTKFYVLKIFLNSQSTFFKSHFIKNPDESQMKLTGVDPNDFHSFLEVLYGEPAIDECNIEGLLLLADNFDVPTVRRRCEEFLLATSKKSFETKQRLAERYHLNDWNYTCALANANSKVKQFTMKHTFENVSSFKDGADDYSELEEHFNANWRMRVKRHNKHMDVYVHCGPIAESNKIQARIDLTVVGRNGDDVIRTMDWRYGTSSAERGIQFQEWEKLGNEYLMNGKLTVEAKVTIIETTGLGKDKILEFGEFDNDVILKVRGTEFYVLKERLANQSTFFKALFSNCENVCSKKPEVTLTGVDPYDFHYFLEVLYGEFAIDDSTIEGILVIADKYTAPMVVEDCETFLLDSSEKSLKKKLELSVKYNLGELKKKCLADLAAVNKLLSSMI